MKKIYQLFLWSIFYCTPRAMFATDTLFVVTNKGNYLLDVSTKTLRPVFEDRSYNPIFSTEGLAYFTKSKKHEITYSYQKRNNFDWWKIDLVNNGIPSEIINFDSKPPGSGYILYPLSWNYDYSSVYFFSTNGDALENEKGIYEYDLKKKKILSRIPEFSYNKIPLVNHKRDMFYFLRSGERGQDIIAYDCKKNRETVLFSELEILRFGILNNSLQKNFLPSCATDTDQPTLYSPFTSNVNFCVTRMGFQDVLICDDACEYQLPLCSELPYCEGHCQLGCTNCRDAIDMDVVVNTVANKILVASTEGFVIRAQTSCPLQGMGQGYGFGYHVVLRHGQHDDDTAPETLYAHLDEVFVEEGDFVYAGQQIGRLGNSQALDCSEDGILDCDCASDQNEHLHYEYHGGNGFLYSTTDIYAPIFEDIGECVPQPNNSYTSGNIPEPDPDVYPVAGNYTVDSMATYCDGTSYITLSAEVCGCCYSIWFIGESVFNEESFQFPVVEDMVTDGYLYVGHVVVSDCISGSSFETIFLEIEDDFFDYSCAPQYECVLMDLNNDQLINTLDIIILIGLVGSNTSFGDIDGDGYVGTGDLGIVIDYFGQVCDD